MMATKTYSVLLIGLGKIGLGYDLKAPETQVYTHTRAFLRHPGFRLAAAVDPLESARQSFATFSDANTYATLTEVQGHFDVVVVALPTELHLQCVREIIRFSPKLVVLEKPVAANLTQALELQKLLSEAQISCAVNYIRRTDPGILEAQKRIRSGEWGALQSGQCVYSKGLLNGASHYIELLNFFFGEGRYRAFLNAQGWYMPKIDPDASFVLEYSQKLLLFSVVDWRQYGIGELDLFFSEGRLRMTAFGETLEWYAKVVDPHTPHSFRLAPPTPLPTDLSSYQAYATAAYYQFLQQGQKLPCTLEEAMAVMKLCQSVIDDS